MEALKMERDSLEKERDGLVTRLWEQEKIQEGRLVLDGLVLSFHIICSGSEFWMQMLVLIICTLRVCSFTNFQQISFNIHFQGQRSTVSLQQAISLH